MAEPCAVIPFSPPLKVIAARMTKANRKSVPYISVEMKSLAAARQLRMNEIIGGSFSVP